MEFVPGPRQTVTVVNLPCHGRGKLVWRNGPAFFIPDEGEPFPVSRVDHGGSSTTPRRSWNRVWITDDSGMFEADIIERGEDHSRWYSPIFGDGWLVTEPDARFMRFEDLDGNLKLRFQWSMLHIGRPDYAEKSLRSRSTKSIPYEDPDEPNWSTYRTKDGSVLGFRRGGPPPPPGTFIPMRAHEYPNLSKKARKAYDEARAAHEKAKAIAAGASPEEQLTLPMGSNR